MGQLVFQATLGGAVNLVGPNTASTFNLNVPAVSSTIATLAAQTFAGTQTFSVDAVVNGLTVGRGAGAVSTNTAVGASALAANTTGAFNVAIGRLAATTNTTGQQNIAVGNAALYLNTTGSFMVAVGEEALAANTTGADNSAYGSYSLFSNTTASYNTAVGSRALYSNTTASNNTAVGYQAGYTNTTGTQNTFIGRQAGRIETSSYNTYIGDAAGYNTQSSGYNTFVGQGAGNTITSGSKNTILGKYDGNQGGLDIRTASNYIVLSDGDGNPRLYIDNAPTLVCPAVYNITSANAANVVVLSSGSIVRSTSALKYKQDIRDVEDFDINALRPVRYKSKCEGDDQTKDYLGLIADEAAEAGFEELVTRGADGEVEGFQYERLTVVLLKELQTLRTRVAQLEGN